MPTPKSKITEKKAYFRWLCSLLDVMVEQDPEALFLWTLYEKPFSFLIAMDENRGKDGVSLREEFAETVWGSPFSLEMPCTILEVLVALARRIQSLVAVPGRGNDQTVSIFWTMVRNLGLKVKPLEPEDYDRNDRKIETWLDRKYLPNGFGGLFPLEHHKQDQTQVEIWYQMQAWVGENFSF